MEFKKCAVCGDEKPLSAYIKRSGGGRRGICRACIRKRRRAAEEAEASSDARAASEQAAAAGERLAEQAACASGNVGTEEGAHPAQGGAESKRKRKSRKNRRRKAALTVQGSEKAPATDSAWAGANQAGAGGLYSPELEAWHFEEGPEPIAAAGDAAAAVPLDEGGSAPKRKRKRRRRGKRKPAGTVNDPAVQEPPAAGLVERESSGNAKGRPAPELIVSGETDQRSQEGDVQDERRKQDQKGAKSVPIILLSAHSQPGSPVEQRECRGLGLDLAAPAPPPADQAPEASAQDTAPENNPKRKRKRKRRRRGKQLLQTVPPMEGTGEKAHQRPPFKRIVAFKGPFSFDTSVLSDRGTGTIRLRGRRETGKRWSTEIPAEMAVRMVKEGAAGIMGPRLIHKLYTKTDFRLLILQRDNYICRYCGRFGDTIDHVLPKSKGGLSTPDNCVCACADCNLKKADSLDFVFDDL